jgi:hypothetical protein
MHEHNRKSSAVMKRVKFAIISPLSIMTGAFNVGMNSTSAISVALHAGLYGNDGGLRITHATII